MYKPTNDQELRIDYCAIDKHVESSPDLPFPYSLTLYNRRGTSTAGSWYPPLQGCDDRMRRAAVALAPTCVEAKKHLILTCLNDFDEQPIIDLIPDHFGKESDTVARLRRLYLSIVSSALSDFLDDVFSQRIVFHSFWKCPASQHHHHAYRGGLAAHSIEMAEWVAMSSHLGTEERDIGIVYALLHDIGKLWCYSKNGPTDFQHLGHELTGYTRITKELDTLYAKWPDASIGLRSLMSGMWKVNHTRPILAVGKLVQAFDQASVEKDRRAHKGSGPRPWTPRPENAEATVVKMR